jgi:hypothetical protein
MTFYSSCTFPAHLILAPSVPAEQRGVMPSAEVDTISRRAQILPEAGSLSGCSNSLLALHAKREKSSLGDFPRW